MHVAPTLEQISVVPLVEVGAEALAVAVPVPESDPEPELLDEQLSMP